jgi:hypothetical protein
MGFDVNSLQPELPYFSWEGKDYTATKAIFYLKERFKFLKLIEKGRKAKAEKAVEKANKELVDFLETIFPGTKADKIFYTGKNSPLPTWAKDGINQYVYCSFLGIPFIPPGLKFTHELAEKLLAIVVAEKAHKEHDTEENIYEKLVDQLKKK